MYILQEEDAAHDVNKNMSIFDLEQALQKDAESYTIQLNEKDGIIKK